MPENFEDAIENLFKPKPVHENELKAESIKEVVGIDKLFVNTEKKPDAPSESYIRWMGCDGNCNDKCKCDRTLSTIREKLSPIRRIIVDSMDGVLSINLIQLNHMHVPQELIDNIIGSYGKLYCNNILYLLDLTVGIYIPKENYPQELLDIMAKAEPDNQLSQQIKIIMSELYARFIECIRKELGPLPSMVLDAPMKASFHTANLFLEPLISFCKSEKG